jgi:hypothetical protein
MSFPSDERAADAAFVAVRFMLDAECSPGLLPRLLQPFARRDLMPDRMWSHRTGTEVHVEIAMEAMPADCLHLVEGNLRQVVGVRQVTQVRPTALRVA